MIDEINSEIAKLEALPASYATIEKLAWLYIVRDHLVEPMPDLNGSEFLCACRKRGTAQVMEVMDELMATIQVLHPRLHDAVLEKLNPD